METSILERTYGAEPGAWTSPAKTAKIVTRYHGGELKSFLCSWENRYKLSEKLRARGYTIYDIKNTEG